MTSGLRWLGLLMLAGACARDGGAPSRSASGARADSVAPARATAAVPGTILFVGTSLTAGLGLDAEEAYPALIARRIDSLRLPYVVQNAGVSGETSAGALRRIEWVVRQPIAVLVLETGANDGLRGLNIDSTRSNIQAILEKTRSAHPDARLVLVQMEAPPNLGANYTSRFRAMFPAVAASAGATLVPFLLEGVAGHIELNQPDGIHPNREGSKRVAETVWRALAPVIGAPVDPSLKTN